MARINFGFTKLLVDDLETSATFYKTVFGLKEVNRVDASINGRAIREIMFHATYQGGPALVLLKFLDAPKPTNDEVILGFMTNDLGSYLERVRQAGGEVTQDITDMPEHRLHVAFARDTEGHLMELVQMYPSSVS